MPKQQFLNLSFRAKRLQLIEAADAIVNEYLAQGFRLTLRQLYYQFVARGLLENTERNYKTLGSAINDARYAGLIDWSAIEDRNRLPAHPTEFADLPQLARAALSSYRLDRWAGQPEYVELWVEKAALAGVLQPLADEWHVTLMVNRGYSSASAMYEAALRLGARYELGQRLTVVYLGDHDPSGEDMVRDMAKRFRVFIVPVSVYKLALTMPQVEEYDPPPNPTKLALGLDTPLPTPDGWTTVRDVQVGDQLFGSDGRIYPVLGKSPVFNDSRAFAFTFACGDTVVCSEGHLWNVDARGRKGGVMTAKDITMSCKEGREQRPVFRVRTADPLELPDRQLPIPPYVLGAWLGDGNTDAEGFACGLLDDELLDNLRAEGFNLSQRHPSNPMRCTIYGLRGLLYKLGVANNKHIPQQYLRSSYTQRLALLQGLMDTDGTVSYNRGMRPCSYGSSLKPLASQVLELVNTLGMRGNLSESRAVFNGEDYGPCWNVAFYPGDLDVFRLSRKRQRLIGATVAERQHWRTIRKAEYVGHTPTQCLTIASPDHLFLAGKHFIATHNSDSRAQGYIAEYGAFSWEVDALPPDVLQQLILEELRRHVDRNVMEGVIEQERQDKQSLLTALRQMGFDVPGIWADVDVPRWEE